MKLAILILRAGLALLMFVYGISQITNPEQWFGYIPPWLRRLLPRTQTEFTRLHGLANTGLGLWTGSSLTPRFAAWLVLAWWLTITPFAWSRDWTTGLRDLTIVTAIAAYITLMSYQHKEKYYV